MKILSFKSWLRLGGFSLLVSLLGATSVMAATFTVDTLTDEANDGECVIDTTLRDAFACADANAESDVIDFSGSGTITLTSNAPGITSTEGVVIDGGGDIVLDGDNHTYAGLGLSGDNIQIKSITISEFNEAGIYLGGTWNIVGGDDVADRVYILGNDSDGNGSGIYPVNTTTLLLKIIILGFSLMGPHGRLIRVVFIWRELTLIWRLRIM